MTDRIVVLQPLYLLVDTQWSAVGIGTVLDVPSAAAFSSSQVTVLAETATSTLVPGGGSRVVRNAQYPG